eukprot:CAMPEP_0117472574 /NCGR_PEP_ID=MMETSP0784-20121206/8320_1 /TAXON_ID=39447 /ORGANISM="" /LENGTH=71 /DNA_ID=CAMNT_0005266735 /DNA_START=305 /DNA_END=517 /DNA_ORIENTATION=+
MHADFVTWPRVCPAISRHDGLDIHAHAAQIRSSQSPAPTYVRPSPGTMVSTSTPMRPRSAQASHLAARMSG